VRATAFYAATTLAVVALGGWLLGLHYASPDERRAVWTSAAIAMVLQVAAFAFARAMAKKNVLAGWAAGAALCMAAVGVLGFSARSLGLPLEAALVSLASFLFVTEIIEPLLLRV
jgi:hypothetical protein